MKQTQFQIILLLCLGLYFSSCSNDKKIEIQYQLEKDSVTIQIDSITLDYYSVFSINSKQNTLFGYNRKTHNIDILDLFHNNINRHIGLEKSGPNGIVREVKGLYYHNDDSLFVYDLYTLYIINSKGTIINKFELKDYFSNNNYFEFICDINFRLKYFDDTKEIFFENLYPTERILEHLTSPIISVFNINTKEGSILPITFSDFFIKTKGRVGYLRWMNFESSKNDSLFFSSQFDDELIIYNRKFKKVSKIQLGNGSNKETTSLINGSDGVRWEHHAINNTHRFGLIYDKWRNLYYRFIWEGIEVHRSDKLFNTMMDKPLNLEVYNANLQLLTTLKLPNHLYRINTWFVQKEGLFVSPTHPLSSEIEEDKLKFDIFKVIKL